MDCVVTYHTNPATCGVARFNLMLAQQLGVPMISLFDPALRDFRDPVLSIKISEFDDDAVKHLESTLDWMFADQAVRLFLHMYTDTEIENEMLRRARAVYCGNVEIRQQVSTIRPDAADLWCPGAILNQELFQPAEIKVFSFGMAHKLRSEYYHKLHRLLDGSGRSYALYISTAIHENTSLDDSFSVTFDELRDIFGEHVHFMGFLSDEAVYNFLIDSTYFAAFFDSGVRSNNTSVNAAMAAGAVVITNLDALSPGALKHGENLLDIDAMSELPSASDALDEIRQRGKRTATEQFGWAALANSMREIDTATGTRGGGSAVEAALQR